MKIDRIERMKFSRCGIAIIFLSMPEKKMEGLATIYIGEELKDYREKANNAKIDDKNLWEVPYIDIISHLGRDNSSDFAKVIQFFAYMDTIDEWVDDLKEILKNPIDESSDKELIEDILDEIYKAGGYMNDLLIGDKLSDFDMDFEISEALQEIENSVNDSDIDGLDELRDDYSSLN